MDRGLWAYTRHPNYFGEISLLTGVAIITIPLLSGWRWVGSSLGRGLWTISDLEPVRSMIFSASSRAIACCATAAS